MRWIVIVLVFITPELKAASASFVISGTYSPANSSLSIYLLIPSTTGKTASLQRVLLNNGQLKFAGQYHADKIVIAKFFVDSSASVSLQTLLKRKAQHELVLDAMVEVFIDASKKQMLVEGSVVNRDFAELRTIERMFNSENAKLKSNSLAFYSQLVSFAASHPQSALLPTIRDKILRMPQAFRNRLVPELRQLLANSDSTFLGSVAGRQLKVDLLRNTATAKYAIGETLPDYVFNDEKDSVSISRYRGKYLLIYFWASWSKESGVYQHLLENAFRQYPTSAFSVLQVSMDSGLESWKKYFEGKKVLWKQARLLRGWDEKVQGAFDIHGLPCTYLVDPNGKIIAKDISVGLLVEVLRKLPS